MSFKNFSNIKNINNKLKTKYSEVENKNYNTVIIIIIM